MLLKVPRNVRIEAFRVNAPAGEVRHFRGHGAWTPGEGVEGSKRGLKLPLKSVRCHDCHDWTDEEEHPRKDECIYHRMQLPLSHHYW